MNRLNNNKGFTFLEVLMTMTISFIFIYSIIYIPTTLISNFKGLDKKLDHSTSLITVSSSFMNDISAENGPVITNGNELIIGDVIYTFSEDGIKRTKGSNLHITKEPATYELVDNVLTITIGDDIYRFNVMYSSFSNKEGDS